MATLPTGSDDGRISSSGVDLTAPIIFNTNPKDIKEYDGQSIGYVVEKWFNFTQYIYKRIGREERLSTDLNLDDPNAKIKLREIPASRYGVLIPAKEIAGSNFTDTMIEEFNKYSDWVKVAKLKEITKRDIRAIQQYHSITDPSIVVEEEGKSRIGTQTIRLRYPATFTYYLVDGKGDIAFSGKMPNKDITFEPLLIQKLKEKYAPPRDKLPNGVTPRVETKRDVNVLDGLRHTFLNEGLKPWDVKDSYPYHFPVTIGGVQRSYVSVKDFAIITSFFVKTGTVSGGAITGYYIPSIKAIEIQDKIYKTDYDAPNNGATKIIQTIQPTGPNPPVPIYLYETFVIEPFGAVGWKSIAQSRTIPSTTPQQINEESKLEQIITEIGKTTTDTLKTLSPK